MADVNEMVNVKPERLGGEIGSYEDFARLRQAFSKLPRIPKIVAKTADAPVVDFPGQRARVLVNGEESAGQMVIFELELQPGFGAPAHHQPNEDEWWFVLEGSLDIQIGNSKARVSAGASAFAPRGCTHAFMNNGPGVARMLTLNTPAGHERFFEAVSQLPEIAEEDARRKLMENHDVVFHEQVVLSDIL